MDAPGPHLLANLATAPEWAQAFREVPREHFIPEAAWSTPMGEAPSRWINRRAAPEDWWEAVYSDTSITTQVSDGATELTAETAREQVPSSSSTAPSVVAGFLELLDAYPGDRVLEVGTGTGYNAALLAARLGPGNVTSIEVDEQVAKQAIENLHRAGYEPRVVTADGAEGWPDGGPYDRVLATCGVREIPYAWVAQTRPGGTITAPWIPNHVGGHRLRLIATGTSAVGKLHGDTTFMMLRAQRAGYPQPRGDRRESAARVDPRRIMGAGPGLAVALAGLLPGVFLTGLGTGSDRVGARDPESGSYAFAIPNQNGNDEVAQIGARDLWDEVEAAYLTWAGWGEPGAERFGVTVDEDGQHVWLDRVDNRIAERAEGHG